MGSHVQGVTCRLLCAGCHVQVVTCRPSPAKIAAGSRAGRRVQGGAPQQQKRPRTAQAQAGEEAAVELESDDDIWGGGGGGCAAVSAPLKPGAGTQQRTPAYLKARALVQAAGALSSNKLQIHARTNLS